MMSNLVPMQVRTGQLIHCVAGFFAFLLALPLRWLVIRPVSGSRPPWVPESTDVTGMSGFFGVNSLHIPIWVLLAISVLSTIGVASNAAGLASFPKALIITLLTLTGVCYLFMFSFGLVGNSEFSAGPIIALSGTVVVIWIALERD